MKQVDLANLQEELERRVETRDKKLEQQMSRLMDTLDERLPKSDKASVHEEQPSMNTHILGGFVSHNGGNHGWSQRGIHIPKIDMRKFNNNIPITWIF